VHEIVVGVDGSSGARAALDWALHEARLRDLSVGMVTVWPADRSSPAAEDEAHARMRTEAAEVAAVAGCGAVPVHTDVRYGQPAQHLVETAAARDGLLVVGSRGRGNLRGALLGSVSQQCAQYARGPVVVVRDDDVAHGAVLWRGAASRVVVGVDGSTGSAAALRFAAEEARLRGGELFVVHAWTDTLTGYGGLPWVRSSTTLRENAEAMVRKSVTAAGDTAAGIRVHAQAVEGVEWDVLSEAAEAADLLVVGSRGRTGWASLLLGSVGLRVLSHAPCPVAVVRPPGTTG
jgi:nucleotide-binding universal stress UspA family protein